MLLELNVVEQRYRAVVEVLSGTSVIEVASAAGAAQYDPVWIRYPKYLPVTGRIGSPVNP